MRGMPRLHIQRQSKPRYPYQDSEHNKVDALDMLFLTTNYPDYIGKNEKWSSSVATNCKMCNPDYTEYLKSLEK